MKLLILAGGPMVLPEVTSLQEVSRNGGTHLRLSNPRSLLAC